MASFFQLCWNILDYWMEMPVKVDRLKYNCVFRESCFPDMVIYDLKLVLIIICSSWRWKCSQRDLVETKAACDARPLEGGINHHTLDDRTHFARGKSQDSFAGRKIHFCIPSLISQPLCGQEWEIPGTHHSPWASSSPSSIQLCLQGK